MNSWEKTKMEKGFGKKNQEFHFGQADIQEC
jgi:hypothetical protein